VVIEEYVCPLVEARVRVYVEVGYRLFTLLLFWRACAPTHKELITELRIVSYDSLLSVYGLYVVKNLL
jgi:hypothetical protein